jgi:hypothetical protein
MRQLRQPAVVVSPSVPRHSSSGGKDLGVGGQVPEQDAHHPRPCFVRGGLWGEVDTDLKADHNRLSDEPMPAVDSGENPPHFHEVRLLNPNREVRAFQPGSCVYWFDKRAEVKPRDSVSQPLVLRDTLQLQVDLDRVDHCAACVGIQGNVRDEDVASDQAGLGVTRTVCW